MKARAEVGGVGDGAELGDGFGVVEFAGLDHFGGEVGEVGALVGEMGGVPGEGFGLAGEVGEIDMGGDVACAGIGERVFRGLVFGKGAQGAAGAVGIVVFRGGKAVIDEKQQAIGDAVRNLAEKREGVGADLGLIVIGKGIAESGGFFSESGGGSYGLRDEFPVLGHEEFLPFI